MPARRHVHTRSIRADVFAREDGLWDLEAELVDTKPRDFALQSGVRPAGVPIHRMQLTVTIDTRFDIVGASARSVDHPYPGHCAAIEPAYARLVGLNLMRGFKRAVRERLGGVAGCTHLTELTDVLPTAAVQAFAGEVDLDAPHGDAERMPFQLDRCHALRTDGPAVARFYPRWYRRPAEHETRETTSGRTTMKIHEYQGKEILKKYGVTVPRSIPAFSVDEAVAAAEKLGGKVWVVKAQIHAGGRGKGGGVKVAKSIDEVRQRASEILGMQLVTHQTGPQGQKVRRLLIEEGADIRKELYVGMVTDRGTQRVALMASSEGGMDIEEVAAHTPEKIHKVFIDPETGLSDADADDVARKIGVPDASVPQARTIFQGLYQRVLGHRCVARRDQPADPDRRRPASSRSTRSSTSIRTRCSAIRTSSRCATSTRRIRPRSRRRSSTSPTSRSTATSAASSTAPGSRWRRWTRSSCSAASPRTSSTSAAARRPRRSPRRSRSC